METQEAAGKQFPWCGRVLADAKKTTQEASRIAKMT